MPTIATVHAALDQATATALAGYTVFYSNQNTTPQTSTYIKQRVFFQNSNQFELGNTTSGRTRGTLVFMFHVKKGSGSAVLNTLQQIVLTSFRSKTIGGAVLQNANMSAAGETEQWAIHTVQVPFYFDS